MGWRDWLRGDPLPWLLEEDAANPGVRYFALRDLLDRPEHDPDAREARAALMRTGPVPAILARQQPDGSWVGAKYTGSFWQAIFLAELGASPTDPRVRAAGERLLAETRTRDGGFGYPGVKTVTVVHCGNALEAWALQRLGFGGDLRVGAAIDWAARAILGGGGVRFFASATSGPGFACGVNLKQPCGWGATKAARALAEIPTAERTPLLERANAATAAFLLGTDLAVAGYPYTERISSTWFKFGFPSSYWADVLETADALGALGYGADPRLAHALELIAGKQDSEGRWKMENSLNGKTWVDIEGKGAASKWVTLRALRVLRRADALATPVAARDSPET